MWKNLEEGDFIVTRQEKNYTLLRVHAVSILSYTFEEITAPEFSVPTSNWGIWLQEGAPGHTAWVTYEVDKNTNQLLSLYSFDKHLWMQPHSEDLVLMQLLTLEFTRIPDAQRKKIGPAPLEGEPDTRGIWTPNIIYEGIKKIKPRIEAWQSFWPKDTSPLSEALIEAYWNPPFPLPYWIEIHGGHYTFKVHVIDSGKELYSPKHLPQKAS